MTTDYHTYCLESPDMPLFMRDWWMDAVCVGKHWELIAGMPCLLRERVGMRFVVMPQQTQIGGLWCSKQDSLMLVQQRAALLQKAAEIDKELRQRHLDYYYQHFPIGSPLPEELKKLGFSIRKHTTYRIDNLQDMDAVRSGYSENKKRQIRKAAALELVEVSPERFYIFHKKCLKDQGKEIAYSEAFFRSLDAACEAHDARAILGLQDVSGALHAAVYLVYDRNTCYFLIPCYAPQFGSSGAGARIVDEAIQFAAKHSKTFDFEGSMIPGVANHYAQFGSTAAYFYEVERVYNPLFRVVKKVYHLVTRKKR